MSSTGSTTRHRFARKSVIIHDTCKGGKETRQRRVESTPINTTTQCIRRHLSDRALRRAPHSLISFCQKEQRVEEYTSRIHSGGGVCGDPSIQYPLNRHTHQ